MDLVVTRASALGKNYPVLARRLRQAMVQGVGDCTRVLGDREFGRKLLVENFLEATEKGAGDDFKVIWVTDISKFGEYEADFGFGKPEWVSLEAWVCLQESDMKFFRQDKEILMLSAST